MVNVTVDCDSCRQAKDLLPFEVVNHFGSPFDGEVRRFCSMACLALWACSRPHSDGDLNQHEESLDAILYDFQHGIANGYPLCCIAQFAMDNLTPGFQSARFRGVVGPVEGRPVYVPCWTCEVRA